MPYIFLYIATSLAVGLFGYFRRSGFLNSLLVSLFFTPITGLILTLVSDKVNTKNRLLIKKGNALVEKNAFQDAITQFEQVIVNDEYDSLTCYNLSCLYSYQNNLPKAADYLILAINNGYSNIKKIKSDPDLKNLLDGKIFTTIKSLQVVLQSMDTDHKLNTTTSFKRRYNYLISTNIIINVIGTICTCIVIFFLSMSFQEDNLQYYISNGYSFDEAFNKDMIERVPKAVMHIFIVSIVIACYKALRK